MATYTRDDLRPARPRCDGCSAFDADGFAEPLNGERRAWVPPFGAECETCGASS